MNQTEPISDQTELTIDAPLRYQWPNKQFDGQVPLRSSPKAPATRGARMKGSIPAIARKLFSTGKPVAFNEAGFALVKETLSNIDDKAQYPRGISYDFGPFLTGYAGMVLFRSLYLKHKTRASL